MIPEPQQEQAALYALGLLDVDEAVAFEQQFDADPSLRELVRDLQETSALLAMAGDGSAAEPPPALRERVLGSVRGDETGEAGKVVDFRLSPWLPWAIAALLLGCTAALSWFTQYQGQKIQFLAAELNRNEHFTSAGETTTPAPAPPDTLAQMSFCALEPTPEFTTAQPRAAVLWDGAHRQGRLRVNRLAPPAEGKDYQLWTVEAGRKEPVSAGVVHVDAEGKAELPFRPVDADGKPVVAVAISLEQAGGSPTNEGPILLLGKL